MVAADLGQPHMTPRPALVEELCRALRSPYVPRAIADLAAVEGYLDVVWPQLAPSVETPGFLGSALYMADMALDVVEQTYEPQLTYDDLDRAGLGGQEREALMGVVDVFHYVQPQLLLVLAALAEAMERNVVGGRGEHEPRPVTEREERHLLTPVRFEAADTPPLPDVAAALGVDEAPDLYRVVAYWPTYLTVAWEELQHLAAYPDFRRRGRALYFYARSGARFLANPLRANPAALEAAGMRQDAIDEARLTIERALPLTAMMLLHAEAMRTGLRCATREVVKS